MSSILLVSVHGDGGGYQWRWTASRRQCLSGQLSGGLPWYAATRNVDAPQGVVRLVQVRSLEAYWQTWPHVAAQRSCFGAATGRCYVQPSPSFSQLSRHAGVGQCAGYQGMPWSRQGAPRIAASATSIECPLDTRHGHDDSPASVVSSLLAGAGERGQVHVPELAAGWVGFAVLGIPLAHCGGVSACKYRSWRGAAGSGSACALACQLCTRAAVPVWLRPQRASEARRQARSSEAGCSSASTAASRPTAPQRSHAGVAWCARRRWRLC